jgi:hypothetical protein
MKSITAGLVTLALFSLGRAARTQTTFFPNDATINYAVGNAIVGYDQDGNSFSPTVSLVNGGSISDAASIFNASVFNMSGGSIGGSGLNANDTSQVFISGGNIGGNNGLFANNSSQVTISGGSIDNYVIAQDTSIMTVTGGQISSLSASGTSTLTISGGSIGSGTSASGNSTINLHGGNPGAGLQAQDSSRFNIFGHNLQATLTDQNGDVKTYLLSGTLADGTDLSNRFLTISGTGSYTLNSIGGAPPVPEPGSLTLLCGLGVMGAGLLRRKRRR